MLTYLHVKNLALIDEAEVEFGEGLNILTGETGAGKSIILGSVNLALGGKVPKDIVRKNADFALVELVFELDDDRHLNALEAIDIQPDNGQIILSRKITNQRSVCKVNGEVVPVAILQKVSGILINIHGQNDNQSLIQKKKHLELLDEFSSSELNILKSKLSDAYTKYNKSLKKLEEFQSDDVNREREISFLQYEISEIDHANLISGEDEELENQFKKMTHSRKIAEACTLVHNLTGYEVEGCAGECIGKAVRELSTIASLDPQLEVMYNQIADIESTLDDFNRQIYDYAQSCEFSQEEFVKTQERLDALNLLKSKYGNTIEDILIYAENQKKKLNDLVAYEETIQKLTQECNRAKEVLEDYCSKVSTIRKKKAKNLTEMIEHSLKDLNFADVRFDMRFERTNHYQENGYDDTEFMISTNPGEELKPLGSVASGGELSRIMLAIKTVMAGKDEVDTLIFDEIDAGISGRTAQKVSEKLAIISKSRQIICITHLPQIAAMADTHFSIEKNVKQDMTITSIKKLSETEQIKELARILSGAEITNTVIQSAKEMKELANRTK